MEKPSIKPEVWLVLGAGLFLALFLYFFFQVNKLSADVQEGLVALRSIETLPAESVNLAEMQAIYERVRESENRALSYLGLFEAIGVSITVLGILGTIIGATLGFGVRGAQEEFKKAQAELETLDQKAKDANLTQFYVSLAATQRALGDLLGAKQTYEHAAELTPRNPVPYYHIGYILTQIKDFDEAEELLKKSLEIDPSFAHAQAALGFVYRRRGDEDDSKRVEYYRLAEKYLLAALRSLPRLVDDDGESWHGALAGMYRRLGNDKKAIEHYSDAEKVTPLSSYPILNRLLLEWQHGRTDRLIESLNRVDDLINRKIKKDKDTYWDRADLMNVQLALGKNEEAKNSFLFFLEVLPVDVEDVLPRVIESTQKIKDLPTYTGDNRDAHAIATILQQQADIYRKRNEIPLQ